MKNENESVTFSGQTWKPTGMKSVGWIIWDIENDEPLRNRQYNRAKIIVHRTEKLALAAAKVSANWKGYCADKKIIAKEIFA